MRTGELKHDDDGSYYYGQEYFNNRGGYKFYDIGFIPDTERDAYYVSFRGCTLVNGLITYIGENMGWAAYDLGLGRIYDTNKEALMKKVADYILDHGELRVS